MCRLWPESKVLALMGVAFYYGNFSSNVVDEEGKAMEWEELWKMFKKNRIDPRLKYINPDKRCHHPVDLDQIDYCWGYAAKVDEGKLDEMEEYCKGCELFKEEVNNA